MLGAAIVWIGLGAVGLGDYERPLGARVLDQAALDAEGFGDKKALQREDEGLRVSLAPGAAESGWKAPQALRVGGDFAIAATVEVRKLPKPGQDDGAAVGLAVATQDVDHPDATLVREVEANGADVYRGIEKPNANPTGPVPQPMAFNPFGFQPTKPVKPPRHTFPARGRVVRLEVRREGSTLRYLVRDDLASEPREIGHAEIGPGDVAGVKLFASNRSGAEAADVVFRDLTIHADRITGLGTAVRTVSGTVFHGDPTAIDATTLVVGGPPPAPPAKPAEGPKPAGPGTLLTLPADPFKPNPPPKPVARVRLDEVESITFERSSALSARLLGQPNVDTTMPGGAPSPEKAGKPEPGDDLTAPPPGTAPVVKIPRAEPKPNGIRDLHLALSGLRDTAINQVTITVPTDKGPSSWRLDTSGSQDWPLTLRRAGVESWADVFLEPPAGDCKDKEFTVQVVYADNQNATAKVKATSSTDPKLAFDPKAPTPPLDARIFLVGDEQLFGKLEAIGEESLAILLPWGDRLDVPLARVIGVYMGMPDHKESPESFAKRLKARGAEDVLLARARDGEVVVIGGIVEGVKDGKLVFRYQEKSRTLPLKGVEGLVLAARPEPKAPAGVRATFAMAGGLVVSGRWTGLEATTWKVETDWGQPLKLPAADVRHVRFRGGRMTYLSDLVPGKVEETPYFGRKLPYRKDVNLDGRPIKLDKQVFEHGLAVHSRSELTYDLDGRYATFEAVVGFDEASRKKGRVDCRVFADGKQLYANPDLRADAPPVKLALPVAGAERLRLVVDFGPDEDTGDRVLWADARLYREPPPTRTASGP